MKTSTGFAEFGVTKGTIIILREAIRKISSSMQIKASGGIKTYGDVCTYLEMGCTRIGSGSFYSLLPKEEGSYE